MRDFGRLDIIGEIAMLPGNHVRGATVTAKDRVQTLVLSRERFNSLSAISHKTHERVKRKSLQYQKEDQMRVVSITEDLPAD